MGDNMYKSEEEFLKNYNDSKYEKPSVTSDILLFSVSRIIFIHPNASRIAMF